jgi:hypothetical protein
MEIPFWFDRLLLFIEGPLEKKQEANKPAVERTVYRF